MHGASKTGRSVCSIREGDRLSHTSIKDWVYGNLEHGGWTRECESRVAVYHGPRPCCLCEREPIMDPVLDVCVRGPIMEHYYTGCSHPMLQYTHNTHTIHTIHTIHTQYTHNTHNTPTHTQNTHNTHIHNTHTIHFLPPRKYAFSFRMSLLIQPLPYSTRRVCYNLSSITNRL